MTDGELMDEERIAAYYEIVEMLASGYNLKRIEFTLGLSQRVIRARLREVCAWAQLPTTDFDRYRLNFDHIMGNLNKWREYERAKVAAHESYRKTLVVVGFYGEQA